MIKQVSPSPFDLPLPINQKKTNKKKHQMLICPREPDTNAVSNNSNSTLLMNAHSGSCRALC